MAPKWIAPMKAVSGDIPAGSGWAAELKWDGMRIHASVTEESVELHSSNGHNVTSSFPELSDLGRGLGSPAIFDGEVVVFDGDRPSFNQLQQRIHVEHPTQSLVLANPVVFIIFDLLAIGDQTLLPLPYRDRRQLLSDFLPDGPTWRTPSYVEDGSEDLLELARSRDLEGIVVKRLASPYKPGGRSNDWIKVKIRLRQEFVVVGWLPGQGALENQIGSVLLAVHETPESGSSDKGHQSGQDSNSNSTLRFAGAVGSGLTDIERDSLKNLFVERLTPPIVEIPELDKPPTWIEPDHVVEVEYGEWPIDGALRHPVYAGRRIDTSPNDVVRELR